MASGHQPSLKLILTYLRECEPGPKGAANQYDGCKAGATSLAKPSPARPTTTPWRTPRSPGSA